MFFHFTPPHMQLLYPVIDSGYVFVGFFFLLSGYVLAYNYAGRPTPLVKRDFWRARFARLYPVYLLSLAISFTMLQAEWHARTHADFFTGLVPHSAAAAGLEPAARHLLEHRRLDALGRSCSSTPPSPGSSACPGQNLPPA